MNSILQNVRYAPRQFRCATGFATIALAVLTLGATLACFAVRFANAYLCGVGAHDAPTFLSVILLLAVASFLAAWLPARLAAAVDPMLALRSE